MLAYPPQPLRRKKATPATTERLWPPERKEKKGKKREPPSPSMPPLAKKQEGEIASTRAARRRARSEKKKGCRSASPSPLKPGWKKEKKKSSPWNARKKKGRNRGEGKIAEFLEFLTGPCRDWSGEKKEEKKSQSSVPSFLK